MNKLVFATQRRQPQLILCGLVFLGSTTSFSVTPSVSRRPGRKGRQKTTLNPYKLFNITFQRQAATRCCMGKNLFEQDKNDELGTSFFDSDVSGPLLLLLVSQFLLFIGVGAVIPAIPLYGKELGFSSASNGIVISAPAVALLLFSKVGGNFADRARKPAMMGGMALIAISDLGTALANNILMLLVARLGLGAGRCIAESGERGLLADLANEIPALRGRALGTQQAITALGISIGAILGGFVIERFGPRATFLCVTAAALVALVLYAFLPETVPQVDGKDSNSKVSSSSSLFSFQKSKEPLEYQLDWADFLKQNKWRGLALAQSGTSVGFACKIACIPVLAASTLPGGAIGAGVLLSAAGLSGLVGAPVGGWLTDQRSARTAVILSGIFSAASLMLVPLTLKMDTLSFSIPIQDGLVLEGSALAFSLVVIGWSMGASAQGPALTALAQEQAPKGAEATAMALPRAAGDGTYIVVPFLLGLATDSLAPGMECAIAGSAILLGVIALAILGDESKQP
eukprot:scaffold9027_cov174-Amphora_coffeaeformis.AAC.6